MANSALEPDTLAQFMNPQDAPGAMPLNMIWVDYSTHEVKRNLGPSGHVIEPLLTAMFRAGVVFGRKFGS